MGLLKLSLMILFHDFIDHLGHLRRYIFFTASLPSMISPSAVEARSRFPARVRARRRARAPRVDAGRGRRVKMAGSDGQRCRLSCNRRDVISSQIHLYIGASIWHLLMENGRSL